MPREDDRGKVLTRLHFNARIYFLAELETVQKASSVGRSLTVPPQ